MAISAQEGKLVPAALRGQWLVRERHTCTGPMPAPKTAALAYMYLNGGWVLCVRARVCVCVCVSRARV